jgi:hypothetical protein
VSGLARRLLTSLVLVWLWTGFAFAASGPATHPTDSDSTLAAAPSRTLFVAGDTTSVPFDLSMGQPVVEVVLNGHGPYRMFLDTGAGTTVLDRTLAVELGLGKRGETRLGDPTDPHAILADVVRIDSLRIGGALFAGVTAASFDRAAIRPGPDMPRGVVGFPVFHELLETLDFPRATLRLSRGHLGDPDGRAVIHYRTLNGIPFIPVDVAGVAMDAHLDTGSPGFLSIPEKDSSRVHFTGPLREVGHGRTVNSVVTFRGATLDGNVRVGNVTFERPLIVLNDQLPVAILGSRALRDCVVTLEPSVERLSIARTRESTPESEEAHGPQTVVAGPAPGQKTAGVMLSPQPGGTLVVVGTMPGSAASKADIQAGDLVLALNGDSTTKLNDDQNRARLHHSPVTLTLKRGDRTFDVTLTF